MAKIKRKTVSFNIELTFEWFPYDTVKKNKKARSDIKRGLQDLFKYDVLFADMKVETDNEDKVILDMATRTKMKLTQLPEGK